MEDEAMRDNVRSALSLQDEVGRDLGARRLNYLLRIADEEAREALQPFGYYSPVITIQRSDRDTPVGTPRRDDDASRAGTARENAGNEAGATEASAPRNGNGARRDRELQVVITIEPGQPVRVRGYRVAVEGPGGEDASVAAALAAFTPREGAILDHQAYDASRTRISKALAARGYFDADFAARRVEVTRAAHAADIDLRWASDERYLLGDTSFRQDPKPVIRDELLQKLVNWDEGEPYDEAKLERLHASLVSLDYFGLVDVSPEPEQARGGLVPVEVSLSPAPRSIYTTGLSYGTVSGPGIGAGVERRYLNSRGHKALAQLDYADKRKALTLQYRVPAFAWLDGWYTASLQAVDEVTDYINSRRVEFVASRSGQFNRYLNLVASLHVLRERWAYNVADDGGGAVAPIAFRYASFVYPSLRAEHIDVDNRLEPRRGTSAALTLRGGKGGSEGDASFAQAHASLQWFHGFDADSRLIARGEIGHTFTEELLDLPPSLRFYAGGDRSVRGYDWHEIGPEVETDHGVYFTGAANV